MTTTRFASPNYLTRRQFLRSTALVAGVATFASPALLRGKSLNEKLNIAIIGAGGRGGLKDTLPGVGVHSANSNTRTTSRT
ncbi:MAG: twin-arginine translocation signal domain-containing protein [Verrucomicrobia bacterium]|nr:twin-arginine translocation signal domain-containing protein [Verrucomicrobiota bacterium]